MKYLEFVAKLNENSGYGREIDDVWLPNELKLDNGDSDDEQITDILKGFTYLNKLKNPLNYYKGLVKKINRKQSDDYISPDDYYLDEDYLIEQLIMFIPNCNINENLLNDVDNETKNKIIEKHSEKIGECKNLLMDNVEQTLNLYTGCDTSTEKRFCNGYIDYNNEDIFYVSCKSINYPIGFSYQHEPYGVMNIFEKSDENFNYQFFILNYFNGIYLVKNVKELIQYMGGDYFLLNEKNLFIKSGVAYPPNLNDNEKNEWVKSNLKEKYKNINFLTYSESKKKLTEYFYFINQNQIHKSKSSSSVIELRDSLINNSEINVYVKYKMNNEEYLTFLRWINSKILYTIGSSAFKSNHEIDNPLEGIRQTINNELMKINSELNKTTNNSIKPKSVDEINNKIIEMIKDKLKEIFVNNEYTTSQKEYVDSFQKLNDEKLMKILQRNKSENLFKDKANILLNLFKGIPNEHIKPVLKRYDELINEIVSSITESLIKIIQNNVQYY